MANIVSSNTVVVCGYRKGEPTDNIKAWCNEAGHVKRVIKKDDITFVEYADPKDVDAAIDTLDGKDLMGFSLSVFKPVGLYRNMIHKINAQTVEDAVVQEAIGMLGKLNPEQRGKILSSFHEEVGESDRCRESSYPTGFFAFNVCTSV